jgi:excisionase family DNA binding protein
VGGGAVVIDTGAELQALASGLASASAAAARLAAAWPVQTGSPALERDLSVAEVARLLGRSTSAVRSWVEAGRFVGAYKLGRAWRVPESALAAFRDDLRSRSPLHVGPGATISPRPATQVHPRRANRGETPDLSAWRRVRPRGTA